MSEWKSNEMISRVLGTLESFLFLLPDEKLKKLFFKTGEREPLIWKCRNTDHYVELNDISQQSIKRAFDDCRAFNVLYTTKNVGGETQLILDPLHDEWIPPLDLAAAKLEEVDDTGPFPYNIPKREKQSQPQEKHVNKQQPSLSTSNQPSILFMFFVFILVCMVVTCGCCMFV